MAYAQLSNQAACEPVRENTALETHLHELEKLNESLGHAVSRGERCADRIMGSTPATIGKGDSKDASVPCLMRRLELAVMEAHSLAEGVHRQFERFERL